MPKQPMTATRRWIAGLGIALLVGGAVFSGQINAAPAQALNLPTWEDVQKAKRSESAAAAKVREIKQLLVESQAELQRLRDLSAAATEKARKAEEAHRAAAAKASMLTKQAKQSQKEADAATERAAALVSQMYRSGGVDRNLELFLEADGDTADALLERLAAMSKATERNTVVSEDAEQAKNTAESLGQQAKVARAERKKLSATAEAEMEAATQAAATQADKLMAQQDQQDLLNAQLQALQDKKAKTVDGYRERLRKEEEARRKAEEERKNNQGGGGAGGGGGGGGGGSNSGGWIAPIPYSYISTYYQQWWGHTGIDLVNGCGVPIVAAKPGTITGVGWLDNLGGNMVYLDHANGYQTRYAHLSRFAVSHGQYVNKGQVIGYVGTTGASTGCHLHYEVLKNGVFQNPINYL